MRVDPIKLVPITSPDSRQPQPAARGAGAGDAPATVVELSPAASTATEASPTLAARLERIRELLLTDDYPIDLDLLASRIVDDELARSRG